jgi:orotidine-5'-phosphate decarboxylase
MVALDNMGLNDVYSFLEELPKDFPWVKLGLEQYLAHGKELIKTVHEKYEKRIFLDLKLHDIPNTVAKALGSLSDLPVDFITVHLSGGRAMLEAVQKVRNEKMSHVNILGVSYLTSLDNSDLAEMFSYEPKNIKAAFERLFTLALETKTQGIVCSPHELGTVKALEEKHHPLTKLCPGIRFQDEISQGNLGDQKRVMSPQEAFGNGADFLVMGRSLTQAKDIHQRLKDLNS